MSNLKVIGITGNARAGKNHIASILALKYNMITWALAFPIKQRVFSIYDDWPLENVIGHAGKDDTLRDLLQQEGTERGRELLREDIWLRATEAFLYMVATEWRHLVTGVIITDIRFPNEAEYVKELGGKIIRVVNRDLDLSSSMYKHASESHIDEIVPDIIIDNTGYPDIVVLLDQICKHKL